MSVRELDARLVTLTGLRPAAQAVRVAAVDGGLSARPWLGTETVARLLGFRVNHPREDDELELDPRPAPQHLRQGGRQRRAPCPSGRAQYSAVAARAPLSSSKRDEGRVGAFDCSPDRRRMIRIRRRRLTAPQNNTSARMSYSARITALSDS